MNHNEFDSGCQDVDAEYIVITFALLNSDDGETITSSLTQNDFVSTKCRFVFNGIVTLISKGGLSTDIGALISVIKDNGRQISPSDFIEIIEKYPAIDLDNQITRLKDLTRRRTIFRILYDSCNKIRDRNYSIDDVLIDLKTVPNDFPDAIPIVTLRNIWNGNHQFLTKFSMICSIWAISWQ